MKSFFEKNINRAIVFLCIITVIVLLFNHYLSFADAEQTNKVMEQYYGLEEDTVDCVYFGTSVTQRAYVTPIAFHDYGITAYDLACGSQPFILTRTLMEESMKTQNVKLFIVELKGTNFTADELTDTMVRKVIDNMKLSGTKLRGIRTATEYASTGDNNVDTTGMSYYFPLLKYHSRWNPSKQPHYYDDIDYYTGYSPNAGITFRVWRARMLEHNDKKIPLEPAMESSLTDLLDYCDTLQDAEVLFVISPYQASELGMGRLNSAKEIVESRGYKVLDFLEPELYDAVGLDERTCFYNVEHLNYYGSVKYTKYLSEYIKANYDIPDRRGQKGCEIWDTEYTRLMNNLEGCYSENYMKMLEKIKKIESEDQ